MLSHPCYKMTNSHPNAQTVLIDQYYKPPSFSTYENSIVFLERWHIHIKKILKSRTDFTLIVEFKLLLQTCDECGSYWWSQELVLFYV